MYIYFDFIQNIKLLIQLVTTILAGGVKNKANQTKFNES